MAVSFLSFENYIANALPPKDYGVKAFAQLLPTGENGHATILKACSEPIQFSKHVILGFAGLVNYDFVAAANPDPVGVLFCDINSHQLLGMHLAKCLIVQIEDPVIFRRALAALPKLTHSQICDIKSHQSLAAQLAECVTSQTKTPAIFRKELSSLQKNSNQEDDFFRYPARLQIIETGKMPRKPGRLRANGRMKLEFPYDLSKYTKVRQACLDGRVAFVSLDCLDEARYQDLHSILNYGGFRVSCAYLSNMATYFRQMNGSIRDYYDRELHGSRDEVQRQFWQNQLRLCEPETRVIYARPLRRYGKETLRRLSGKEVSDLLEHDPGGLFPRSAKAALPQIRDPHFSLA